MKFQTGRLLTHLSLVFALVSLVACQSSALTATPDAEATQVATEAIASAPTAADEPTSTPAPALLSPSRQAERAWDDRTIFRQGLIGSEQEVLDRLPGASIYNIDFQISDDLLLLEGYEEVRYTNQEDEPLDKIYFRLFPNTAGGAAQVSAVKVDGQDVEPAYEFEDSALRVPLPAALKPGEQTVIQMDFEVKVAQEMAGNYGLFGYFDGVLVLDEFYPVIPVYDDEGWNVEVPPPNGDVTYFDASFYRVRVIAPANLKVVASGVEISREQAGDHQSLTFAAGPARDFYLAASEKYTLISETVGETTVNSYTFPEWKGGARLALQFATDALKSFNARFGVYPYTEFDIVSTPMLASGVEYPGIVAISLELYDPDAEVYGLPSQVMLESAVAHEVAHQWFYNMVGNDQIDEPWLDEALAQYVTGLYYVDAHGQTAARNYRGAWDWMWNRVDRADTPIGLPSAAYAQEEYSPIVYGRGPLFVTALAEAMGQETFDEFLRDYFESHQWEIGTGEAFRQLAEQHCRCDLTALFQEWVYEKRTTLPVQPTPAPSDPFDLISQESLFASLEDLTAIQAYSGWRNSASQGEAEALDYVADRLGELAYLQDLGLALERQSFHVFLATELWETRLHLTVDSQQAEVPADGLRGPRDNVEVALHFDSDGRLNDADRNPIVVDGPVVLVRSAAESAALTPADLETKVVFLDYAIVDGVLAGRTEAVRVAQDLLDKGPAGLVLVTQFSTAQGSSHGFGVGDVSVINQVQMESAIPILYVRLEDLAPAGVTDWDGLAKIEEARLTWDADVFSPGTSGNLVARIPGVDSSQAIILGAHIDSPNSPGAMDDGSGSVALLEVARVLDAARAQPPLDLYLAWFGSEELGLYGAAHFVATHQELLDRTLAMLEVDCLSRPLDGISADLTLVTWSDSRLGDGRLTWPDYLIQSAARQGISALSEELHFFYAEDLTFRGFDVPNADLIYTNDPAMEAAGGWHYAAHVHDPYDTAELAREVGDVLEQMAQVALAAALGPGQDRPTLRVAPQPDRRILFVGSHTESVHMAPTTFIDLGLTLAWEGFDVDLIPYGQAVTPADLEDTDLVVALPVLDYPSPEGDLDAYDEAWSPEEIATLEAYVAGGGLLVLTNSAYRLKYHNMPLDPNEDWDDANRLAMQFGVSYQEGMVSAAPAKPDGEHPLMEGVSDLEVIEGNGLPFTLAKGQVLAQGGGEPVIALVGYGDAGGQVLALADLGILGNRGEPRNLNLWRNLAQYARSR